MFDFQLIQVGLFSGNPNLNPNSNCNFNPNQNLNIILTAGFLSEYLTGVCAKQATPVAGLKV